MAERRTAVKMAAEPNFLQFNDLACEAVGGKVIFASDEWFAPAANLLKLGVPGLIYGFDVNTSFFTGNHSPYVSIQAGCLDHPPTFTLEGDRTGMAASDSQLAAVAKLGSEAWPELVCMSELQPGYSDSCHNYFQVNFNRRVTHLRLNMYPDGGIARLRVFGIGQRDWSSVSINQDIDLVALTNGGVCLGYSDAHFGHPRNMIGLGQAANMGDGWETARRLDRPKKLKVDQRGILQVPGWEWAVFRLGHRGVISSIEVDTNHFKGNFPDSCRIEACTLTPEEEAQCIRTKWNSRKWKVLLPPQKMGINHKVSLCINIELHVMNKSEEVLADGELHLYSVEELTLSQPISHIRLVIAPDGGVSRLRLWGRPTPVSKATANQQRPASKL
eukprot:superscaffoldBa00004920_g19644